MKTIFIALLLIFSNFILNAQNLIAVQNNSSPSFFTTLDSAIIHATDGDTIYLPGGSFPMYRTISHRIYIIGMGHNPDSTTVTMPTNITGPIYLNASASGGSMTGINFTGTIYFGTSNAAENYTFFRCKLGDISSYESYSWSCISKNNKFYENAINTVFLPSGESNVFLNNIFNGALVGIGSNNIIKNNIFLGSATPLSTSYFQISSSTFENNIFIGTPTIISYGNGYFDNNVFQNNLFVENINFPYLTTNMGFNNIVNQNQDSFFVNQSGFLFDYKQDYHLQPSSPGKNGGRDGTDIGIYGGVFPWKEGSIPANPHFQSVKIAPKTDTSGNLKVNIKVAAQDH